MSEIDRGSSTLTGTECYVIMILFCDIFTASQLTAVLMIINMSTVVVIRQVDLQ